VSITKQQKKETRKDAKQPSHKCSAFPAFLKVCFATKIYTFGNFSVFRTKSELNRKKIQVLYM